MSVTNEIGMLRKNVAQLRALIEDKEITINKLRKEVALLTQTKSNNTWAEYDNKSI
tara:strand:+ start:578 stop:745 length:168 start_codon:yes stop_codon:yes gene_type:complete